MPVRSLVPVATFLLKEHLNWYDSRRFRQLTQPRHGEHPPTGSHCFFHGLVSNG